MLDKLNALPPWLYIKGASIVPSGPFVLKLFNNGRRDDWRLVYEGDEEIVLPWNEQFSSWIFLFENIRTDIQLENTVQSMLLLIDKYKDFLMIPIPVKQPNLPQP